MAFAGIVRSVTIWTAMVSFALVAGLVTIIPGLDTALVLRSAVTDGRRHAFATAFGINTGALIWGAAAAAGVSALLAASSVAYTVVRVAGAAYLVWLGIGFLRRAARAATQCDGEGGGTAGIAPARTPRSPWRSWRRGLLTNLLNPKIGAFYIAVLPQFIPPQSPHVLVGLLLALVHDAEGMVWFSALILGAGRLRHVIRRRSVARGTDAVTGSVLVAFGMRLGFAAR